MTVVDDAAGPRSPSGRYRIALRAWEPRMSLWVETPQIIDVQDSAVLLEFDDPCWSLDAASWQGEHTVELRLRKFPGEHRPAQVIVQVNCRDRTATLAASDVCALSELERRLDAQLRAGADHPVA